MIGEALMEFASAKKFRSKGALAVALGVTRQAARRGLPLDPALLLTPEGGQVTGLGGPAIQAILADHGIERLLAAEGGRTSRGSINRMRSYVAFLNEQHALAPVDFGLVEIFWVDRVRNHFAGKPFAMLVDTTLSVQAAIAALLASVEKRQSEVDGATILGTVLQHLVGAKLALALDGRVAVASHGANTNDASARGGDFDLGDTVVHVTTAPTEALMGKCAANLAAGLRPLVVTLARKATVAAELAEQAGIGARVDILGAEQFLTVNIHELGGFDAAGRAATLAAIVERYNRIVDAVECDPALRIVIAGR